MSWQIAVIENTLKIDKKTAKQLFKLSHGSCDDIWWREQDVMDRNGYITFNSDHMEHMDFLRLKGYQAILEKNEVKGQVRFGSLDGDNFGKFWGYSFDGDKDMSLLEGELKWHVVEESK